MATDVRRQNRSILSQSAMPWMTSDSTPTAPVARRWRADITPHPPLFSNGVTLVHCGRMAQLLELATSPLHVLYAARRFFIPWLLAFGRLSAVLHLSMKPNRTLHLSALMRCRFLSPALLRGSISRFFMSFPRAVNAAACATGWPAPRS